MRVALLAGLSFAVLALVPLTVLWGLADRSFDLMAFLAPAALGSAALLGTVFWWGLVASATTPTTTVSTTTIRGALAGLLTGLLAHPLTWWITMVVVWASGTRSSLGDRAMGPLVAVPGALLLSLFSLLVLGWLTVPLGAAAGALMARTAAFRPVRDGARGVRHSSSP